MVGSLPLEPPASQLPLEPPVGITMLEVGEPPVLRYDENSPTLPVFPKDFWKQHKFTLEYYPEYLLESVLNIQVKTLEDAAEIDTAVLYLRWVISVIQSKRLKAQKTLY